MDTTIFKKHPVTEGLYAIAVGLLVAFALFGLKAKYFTPEPVEHTVEVQSETDNP